MVDDGEEKGCSFKVLLRSSKLTGRWLWEPSVCIECINRQEEKFEMERSCFRDKDLKVDSVYTLCFKHGLSLGALGAVG